MATKKGRGLLMVYADVPAPLEDEFNRWYNEEHIPERLAIPGVLNAARYVAVRGGPQYLACYELEEPEAYFSAVWQQRLAHPTPWTQRMSPDKIGTRFVRNVYRLVTPETVSAEIAQAEMAPALLVGRMEVPPKPCHDLVYILGAFSRLYGTDISPHLSRADLSARMAAFFVFVA